MKTSTKRAIDNHVDFGYETGNFVYAVLTNNLKEAVGRADLENLQDLHEIVSYCYCQIPSMAWGSVAEVDLWREAHLRINGNYSGEPGTMDRRQEVALMTDAVRKDWETSSISESAREYQREVADGLVNLNVQAQVKKGTKVEWHAGRDDDEGIEGRREGRVAADPEIKPTTLLIRTTNGNLIRLPLSKVTGIIEGGE